MMDDLSQHEYVTEVNYAIDIYQFCKEFKCLPRAGGLFEQDAYIMLLLEWVSRYVAEKAQRDAPKPKGGRK